MSHVQWASQAAARRPRTESVSAGAAIKDDKRGRIPCDVTQTGAFIIQIAPKRAQNVSRWASKTAVTFLLLKVDPAPEAEPTLVDGRGAFFTVRARSDSTTRPLRKEDGDV